MDISFTAAAGRDASWKSLGEGVVSCSEIFQKESMALEPSKVWTLYFVHTELLQTEWEGWKQRPNLQSIELCEIGEHLVCHQQDSRRCSTPLVDDLNPFTVFHHHEDLHKFIHISSKLDQKSSASSMAAVISQTPQSWKSALRSYKEVFRQVWHRNGCYIVHPIRA